MVRSVLSNRCLTDSHGQFLMLSHWKTWLANHNEAVGTSLGHGGDAPAVWTGHG